VTVKVAGYTQPMYSPDYGGGTGTITLTANVSCPAVQSCPPGTSTYSFHGDMVCCPQGTTYDGAGNCATPCPTGSSWDRRSGSCLCGNTNQSPVNGVCPCPGNTVMSNGSCGCGGAEGATLASNTCSCPYGEVFQVAGGSAACQCPSGTYFNGCSTRCEPPHTCPKAADGATQVWNCSTNKCVPIQRPR
jgi:hypothetical protein